MRQDGLCTPVCAAHHGLLAAILPCTVGTGCTVRADLDSKMPFGAPKCPSELQLGPPSRTPSSTWRFLGRFLVLLQPSESSSRLDESSILMVQTFLQSKRSWTAVSQLCSGSRTPFGLNLEALGNLLGRSWSLFGRSWPLLARSWPVLGGSWGAPRRPWEALGRLLGPTWSFCTPLGLNLEPLGPNLEPLGCLLGST